MTVANESTSPHDDLDSSCMSINGHSIPVEFLQMIVDDSTYLNSQQTANLIVCSDDCSKTDDMIGVYLAFLSLKKTDLANAKRIWEEQVAKIKILYPDDTSSSPPCYFDKIYDYINYFNYIVECYEFLQKLPLKTLYEFTEFLDSIMSESLRFAIRAVARCLADSLEAMNAIEQFVEEQQTESVLSKHDLEFHHWNTKLNTKEPYPYRFIDSIWVSIKVELFRYALVSNRGCSFVLTGNMAVLSRLTIENALELKVAALRQKYVTRLEMLQDGNKTELGEFAELNLKDCLMTYAKLEHEELKRPVSYKGGIFFHDLLGPIRHGNGTTFYNPSGYESPQRVCLFDENHTYLNSYKSVEKAAEASGEDVKVIRDTCNSENSHVWEWECNIERGVYIFDEMHSFVAMPLCECSICSCEDFSEVGDYGVCYFSSEKEKWGGLGFDEECTATVDYCASCDAEMVVHERRLLQQLRDEGIEEANDLVTPTNVTCIKENRDMRMLMVM